MQAKTGIAALQADARARMNKRPHTPKRADVAHAVERTAIVTDALARHEAAGRELIAIVAATARRFRPEVKTEPVICECCEQGAHEGNEPWVELVHTIQACDCKCNTSANSVEVIQ